MKSYNKVIGLAVSIGWAMCGSAMAGTVGPLTTFEAGTPAVAAEVNDNFSAVAAAVDGNAADIATKQNRVNGTCTVGNAIRAINADGSVTCQNTAMTLPTILNKGDSPGVISFTTSWGTSTAVCVTTTVTPSYDTIAEITGSLSYQATDTRTVTPVLVVSPDGGTTWNVAHGWFQFVSNVAGGWGSVTLPARYNLTAGTTYIFGIQQQADAAFSSTASRCNMNVTIF